MALIDALLEWLKTCDSAKCTEEHQSELHSMSANWFKNPKMNPRIVNWFKYSNSERNWGKVAWIQTEATFVGKLEEKHRAYENATRPEISSTEGQLHNFLKTRFVWDFGKFAKKDLLIEERRQQPPVPGDNNKRDELDPLDQETVYRWQTAFQQDEVNTNLIAERINETNVIQGLQLQDGDWSLLLLLSMDLKLNEASLSNEHWKTGGLPTGKTQRYQRRDGLLSQITGAARKALSSQFVEPKHVDVVDAFVASRMILKQLFQLAEQKAPEKFRARVFEIVNTNQP
jgi:hypothetical protein